VILRGEQGSGGLGLDIGACRGDPCRGIFAACVSGSRELVQVVSGDRWQYILTASALPSSDKEVIPISSTRVMPSGGGTIPSSDMLPVELTLIVAATRNMGIGRAGTLPWTGLKKEMAYFARVTKRLDPMPSDSNENNVSSQIQVNFRIN